MKAITIVPGKANSASLQDVPEPPATDGDVLIRTLALGICGTDFELVSAEYGWAPPGESHLILGHESLGRVMEAPSGSGFEKDDLVVGIVRRPDPEPCMACAVDQWDMCRNGKYTERGIKERNGFGSERFRNEAKFTVKIDKSLADIGVLMEPRYHPGESLGSHCKNRGARRVETEIGPRHRRRADWTVGRFDGEATRPPSTRA